MNTNSTNDNREIRQPLTFAVHEHFATTLCMAWNTSKFFLAMQLPWLTISSAYAMVDNLGVQKVYYLIKYLFANPENRH